ncbi:Chaperone protein HtpG [Bradyrhizobium sp.]|uniref:HD domain-containing protein n=1 Tax=Bradyrhizobium sp. TaxID=376 RepID=UPI0007C1CD08|nr:ATP-binding protein [Bradyrhizobium sp.]CUT09720.1 Chaperone protein HtpG [Bradyrhizobium sp.]
MSRPFEDSRLWRSAFGSRTKDRLADERKSLELAYRQFRDAVLPLLRQSAIDLPALTVHDETHVDQLWDVASEICGDAYPLNPLEGFVLGGAFLLHDSALCLAAYEDSLQGLLKTSEWKDSVNRIWRLRGVQQPSESQTMSPPDDIKNAAIFEVLRRKHAEQASLLLDRTWVHPATGRPVFLLDNLQLQDDYGKLVGQIAASHHWQIKRVENAFENIVPASSSWPREWQVDSLKLACILRCADAAAIDERRAPSRLFALRPLSEASRRHWVFQNRMYPPHLEDETLVFVSKAPFELAVMNDWWLCFDAANIVDEELRASNALLAAYRRPPFAARQVFGAKIVEDFSKKVLVQGWTPIETSLRITNIPSIIKRLGGTTLYGEDPEALFRELIQNAADSIRARRRRDPSFAASSKYAGQILVRARLAANNVHLSIEDDGIGMPTSVLTGPLLDFGTSFWNSELAATLYPGLQSDSEFSPAGKYGIGFFAAFMFSDHVTVTSRPFGKGHDDYQVLSFEHGLSGRSQLRRYDQRLDGDIVPRVSTRIETRVPLARLMRAFNPMFAQPDAESLSLHQVLALRLSQICFALDVAVSLEMDDGRSQQMNVPYYKEWTNDEFVDRLIQVFRRENTPIPANQARCVEPLVNDDGRVCGRAFVSFSSSSRAPIRIIDGFAKSRLSYIIGTGDAYEGIVEQRPVVASRDSGEPIASASAWGRWGSSQLRHILRERQSFSGRELFFAAAHLAALNLDVSLIAHCYLVDKFLPLTECINVLKKVNRIVFLARREHDFLRDDSQRAYRIADVDDFCRPLKENDGTLISSESFIQSQTLHSSFERLSEDLHDATSHNVLSYFLKLLNEQNLPVTVSMEDRFPIGKFKGYSTHSIKDGDTIYVTAAVVTLSQAETSPVARP